MMNVDNTDNTKYHNNMQLSENVPGKWFFFFSMISEGSQAVAGLSW